MARTAGRPKEPALTRGGVIAAALAIIDRDGMDGLNIRALGQVLGVNSASLYHHFANKDEILVGVARSVLRRVDVKARPGEPWPAQIVGALREVRRALLAHPNAVPLILELHPRMFSPEPYARAAELLERHGVPPGMILTMLDGLESLAIGSALHTLHEAARDSSSPRPPALTRIYEQSTADDEERFELACHALIDGLLMTSAIVRPRTGRSIAGAAS